MNVKPGYKTTEFYVTLFVNLIAAVLTVMVASALVSQEQANAINALALAVAGIVPIFAGAFVAGRYVSGRAAVKGAAIEPA